MKMYDSPQSVDKYLNVELECDCGRTHYAPIKAVNVSSGALRSLPGYVREYGYSRPYIICDKITYEIAGKRCAELLSADGIASHVLIIKHLGFDEATLGEIVINKPDDCDLMIGCGTGSITDMLRYASFKLALPCFTVCTAAPMDGFSASAGIMNVDNLKCTMPAHSTEVIIGDTDMLSAAPYRMTLAGFSDLIAKLSSLNDWRLGAIINGEHYCEKLASLVGCYVADMIGMADKLKQHEPEAIGKVMNALLLSGATISLYGSSRAISGAEHHMSHYWEVLGEQRGKSYAMHGEQVAVGTVLTLILAEELRGSLPDFGRARRLAAQYDAGAWREEILRAYGNAAEAIIRLEAEADKNGIPGRLRRIDSIEEHWAQIKALLEGAYPSARLLGLLEDLGCPATPRDIGITPDVLKDTFMYSKDTRDCYTICQMAWDLGVLDELSDRIIEKLRANGQL